MESVRVGEEKVYSRKDFPKSQVSIMGEMQMYMNGNRHARRPIGEDRPPTIFGLEVKVIVSRPSNKQVERIRPHVSKTSARHLQITCRYLFQNGKAWGIWPKN